MAEYVITEATAPDDIAAVAKLFELYASTLPIDLSYQKFGAEVANLPGKYVGPDGAMMIARDHAGKAAGCVGVRRLSADVCEMKRLFTLPETRGSGLGRALAQAIINQARRLNYRRLVLDTLVSMSPRSISTTGSASFVSSRTTRRRRLARSSWLSTFRLASHQFRADHRSSAADASRG